MKIVVLGDSIAAGNPGWDPDPGLRDREGHDPQSQWEYWAERANSDVHFDNRGVGGERTDEIMARLERNLVDVQGAVIQGGINDIVQNTSLEKAAQNLRHMVERVLALGLWVAVADVLPWNNGWPEAVPQVESLNNRIHAIAQDLNVNLLPFYATLEDEDRLGRMREEWTDDGNHPSVEGYRRLGEIAFSLR